MRRILAIALLLALLCGCGGQITPAGENAVTLYYRRADTQSDESFSSPTGALAQERITLGGDFRAQDLLERYLQGPDSDALVTIFPEGTACTKMTLQNGVLTLHMNEAYGALTGYARTLATAGLTLTMTQLEQVESVQIRTPNGALIGQSTARWTPEQFLLQDMSWLYPERTVQLYFSGPAGMLMAEKRAISYQEPEMLPENTLQALLDGPESSQLRASIPDGTQILDLHVTGTLCTVVFSEEFASCDTDRTRAEAAVRCVVATLCGLSEIDEVQICLPDGANLTYCSIAEPLRPESSWYT